MASKFYHTRSNSTKQGVQTVKRLVTKQCLMVFGRQTFPVCPGPKTHSQPTLSRGKKLEKFGEQTLYCLDTLFGAV